MSNRGFTIAEMLVVIVITGLIMVALVRFTASGWSVSRETALQQMAGEDARVQLKRIAKAMREARISDAGAYPLVVMDPQHLEFYADVDGDDATELVRYQLAGTNLERGITEPTGSPLAYDKAANEKVSVVAASIRNGGQSIFTYYTGDYPANQTPLSQVDLADVKYIQFRLLIDSDPNVPPEAIDIVSQVQLRNLKTNLGET